MMSKTISFHVGNTYSRGHNIRDERYVAEQKHIDKTLTHTNVIVRDTPVRQAYDEIFGRAVEEYNSQQTRADRMIDSYYDKIKHDKRKHPVYECVVQIGDRTDTGNSATAEKQVLIKYAEEWEKRNPNLRLVGAYIHCDEPSGTVHLHCDYIPVAVCSRGMRLQNSLSKALEQQGFRGAKATQTAQMSWQASERDYLEQLAQSYGIDVKANQGLSHSHLSKREYIRAKEQQSDLINSELKPLKEELDKYLTLEYQANEVVVERKKVPFTQKVKVLADDVDELEEQAKAYRLNRSDILSLRERERELAEREQQYLKNKEQLDKNARIVLKNQKTVEKMYERQRNLNELLEKAENEISALNAENGSLFCDNIDNAKTIQDLQKRLKTAQESVRGAYESLTNVVKAVGMLKYDKEQGYGVDLTEEQERLISAITNYGAKRAREDGQPDLAEKMEKTIGMTYEIQQEINKLTPINRGYGLSL